MSDANVKSMSHSLADAIGSATSMAFRFGSTHLSSASSFRTAPLSSRRKVFQANKGEKANATLAPPSPISMVYPQVPTLSHWLSKRDLVDLSADAAANRRSAVSSTTTAVCDSATHTGGHHCCLPCSQERAWITSVVCLLLLLLILLLIALGLAAAVPCMFARCHARANTCLNSGIFQATCVCDYGYNGDGRQYCDECGVAFAQQNARVVGGKPAVPHSWPSAALIVSQYKATVDLGGVPMLIDAKLMCSGALINRRTVLTAAHCILKQFNYDHLDTTYQIDVKTNSYFPTLESMYTVYLGVQNRTAVPSNISASTRSSESVAVAIEQIIVHPQFDEQSVRNDIAILRLSRSVELNDRVQLACLPNPTWSSSYPYPNTAAWVLGWGTTSELSSDAPDILQNTRVTIYDNALCDSVLPDYVKDHASQICAGEWSGGKDTCQGDSGGPIFVRETVNNKPKFVSIGIVSFGDGCAKAFKPGVYTKNQYFLDWIAKNSVN